MLPTGVTKLTRALRSKETPDQTTGKEHLHMRRDADYTLNWLKLDSVFCAFHWTLQPGGVAQQVTIIHVSVFTFLSRVVLEES